MDVLIEDVHFHGHGRDALRGILVAREGAGSEGPGLVLVHGSKGLDEHNRELARRFAHEGFVVLVPDLYSREGADGELHDRRVMGDLDAALEELVSARAVDPERLAAVGCGVGGTFAFLLGCHSRKVTAVVAFYSEIIYPELGPHRPVQPLEMALNLSCPFLGHYGQQDASIPLEHVESMRDVLSQFAREFEIETYPGASHAFLDEQCGDFEPQAASAAWSHTLRFLEEHLAET